MTIVEVTLACASAMAKAVFNQGLFLFIRGEGGLKSQDIQWAVRCPNGQKMSHVYATLQRR